MRYFRVGGCVWFGLGEEVGVMDWVAIFVGVKDIFFKFSCVWQVQVATPIT